MELDKKIQKSLHQWKTKQLSASTIPDSSRFKVETVVDETVLAICLKIGNKNIWFPKAKIDIGIHPSGRFYAVDLPMWLVKSNRLA